MQISALVGVLEYLLVKAAVMIHGLVRGRARCVRSPEMSPCIDYHLNPFQQSAHTRSSPRQQITPHLRVIYQNFSRVERLKLQEESI